MNPRALFAQVDPLSARPKLRSAGFAAGAKAGRIRAPTSVLVKVINRDFEGQRVPLIVLAAASGTDGG